MVGSDETWGTMGWAEHGYMWDNRMVKQGGI